MAKFHDAIAALQGIEGDYPGDMFDTLTGAYDEDVAAIGSEVTETATAKVNGLTAEIAEMGKALEAAKAHNYDLMMSAPATGGEGEETSDDGDESDDESNDDEGIDSLFESEEN